MSDLAPASSAHASSTPPASTLITAFRTILTHGATYPWVVFSHGTVVILTSPSSTLSPKEQATEIMREWGPVHIGTPAADFNILDLMEEAGGYMVSGHHRDMLTFVPGSDVEDNAERFVVGMVGRGRRDEDGRDLEVVHVEDPRGVASGSGSASGSQ
ncbi:hypothetical protein BJY04DRAFT_220331 [Aspergillus karnatakaensis]|uniref:uncharacterized protein n=1 Tax=Aspergillus karnatakaensis TaxID=1810916 RepID=UPI003CCE10A3